MNIARLAKKYVQERLDKGELAKSTARQLRYRLELFAAHISVEDPKQLKRRHVERWLATPGLSPHYRRTRLSSVRTFCQWMTLNGYMQKDPTLGLKFVRLPPLIPRALTADQSAAIATAAIEDPDIRAAVIITLMLSEGLRRAEVAAVTLGDIDRRAGTLDVRGKGGRGGVTARLPLTEETQRILARYLPSVPYGSGPLLRSHNHPDRGISPEWVGQIVLRVMRSAGVKEYVGDGRSAHSLRHTAAQDLVDRGVEMRVVQRVLRHASIRNTENYVRREAVGLREAMSGRNYFTPITTS